MAVHQKETVSVSRDVCSVIIHALNQKKEWTGPIHDDRRAMISVSHVTYCGTYG